MADTHGTRLAGIYVSGFSESTTLQDLRALFGKVVHIESMYMPGPSPTGLKRNFAVLKSSSDPGEVAKCVKKLNNCLWKGGTLVVEAATEHYDERLRREGQEAKEAAEKAQQEKEKEEAQPVPIFDQDHLRLKRAIGERGIGHHVIVSTEQLMRKSNRRAFILRGENKHEVLTCGRRLVFEYSEEGTMTEREVDAWGNDVEVINNQSVGDEQQQEDQPEGREREEEPSSVLPAAAPVAAPALAPVPTGQRKGFGTLLPQIKPVKASSRESAAKFQAIMDDADTHFAPPPGGLGAQDVNDLVQENEFNEEDMIEVVPHDNDEEHVPAASHQELQAGELKGARDKALALASLLMRGDREEGVHLDEAQDAMKNAYASRERVFKSGWDTTTIAHYDPSQEDSAQFLMDEEEALQLLQKARERKAEKEREKREAGRSGGDYDVDGDHNSGSLVEEKPVADLDKLKDIFQKDGGVWFGDDGTLKESVGKGNAVQDKMFLEAEKFGFDIRGAAGGAREGMTFDFDFGGGGGSSGGEPVKVSIEGEVKMPSSSSSARDTVSIPDHMDMEDKDPIEADPAPGDEGVEVKIMSIFDIVRSAKAFRRDADEDEEVVQDWKNTRDKLVVNYKRRKTDARKRSAKYGVPASSPAAPPSTDLDRRKSRGGKKHRKK